MGYLIAAYAVSALGLGGYACWLWRERRVLRARLARFATHAARNERARSLTSESAAEY